MSPNPTPCLQTWCLWTGVPLNQTLLNTVPINPMLANPVPPNPMLANPLPPNWRSPNLTQPNPMPPYLTPPSPTLPNSWQSQHHWALNLTSPNLVLPNMTPTNLMLPSSLPPKPTLPNQMTPNLTPHNLTYHNTPNSHWWIWGCQIWCLQAAAGPNPPKPHTSSPPTNPSSPNIPPIWILCNGKFSPDDNSEETGTCCHISSRRGKCWSTGFQHMGSIPRLCGKWYYCLQSRMADFQLRAQGQHCHV